MLLISCFMIAGQVAAQAPIHLDVNSTEELSLPVSSSGKPAAGKRVAITSPEYSGTDVYHMVYLPEDWNSNWKAAGERLPIIFEYTGNYYPKSGSTGEVEDAGLGFGLSAGKYIWVTLPFVSEDQTDNAVTWWGDEEATIQYAKTNVPRIIEKGSNVEGLHSLSLNFHKQCAEHDIILESHWIVMF